MSEVYAPTWAVYITPASEAIAPDAISEPQTMRSEEMPASRAASRLPPTANIRRPSGVCSSTNQITTAMTSR